MRIEKDERILTALVKISYLYITGSESFSAQELGLIHRISAAKEVQESWNINASCQAAPLRVAAETIRESTH